MKTKILKLATVLSAAALTVSFSGPAAAGSATANLNVSALVSGSCTITGGSLAFGYYDPTVTNAAAGVDLNAPTSTGSIQVNCVTGSPSVSIGLGNGLNYTTTRRMLGTLVGNYMNYQLYLPPSTTPGTTCTYPGATIWGTTAGTDTLDPANTTWDGTVKTFYVCGTVPKGQTVAADTYTDTVVATVNF